MFHLDSLPLLTEVLTTVTDFSPLDMVALLRELVVSPWLSVVVPTASPVPPLLTLVLLLETEVLPQETVFLVFSMEVLPLMNEVFLIKRDAFPFEVAGSGSSVGVSFAPCLTVCFIPCVCVRFFFFLSKWSFALALLPFGRRWWSCPC